MGRSSREKMSRSFVCAVIEVRVTTCTAESDDLMLLYDVSA